MLGIYTRISVDRENQLSTKEQRLQGIELANKLKLDYKLYEEAKGTSGGKKIHQRPKLNELINDVENGLISAIYLYNQDRAERDEATWFNLVDLIVESDIKLYENGKLIDLSDENVRMISGIKSIMNANFRRKTSRQIKNVLKRKVGEGKAHGILPYGYGKDDNGYLSVDLEESKIVKRIYEMSLNGIGTRSIANQFNEEGIATRYNKIGKGTITTVDHLSHVKRTQKKVDISWSGNTIRGIINNPIYKGERQFSGEVYKVPNIVTPAYWQKANDNLKNNSNNNGRKASYNYLLRGKLICGKCGRNYYGRQRANKKDNFYMCSSKRIKGGSCGNRSINIDVLESFIWQRFFADSELKELMLKYLNNNDYEDRISHLELNLKGLNEKLDKNKKALRNVIRLAVDGLLSDNELLPEKKRLDDEREDLQRQINNLKDQLKSYTNYAEDGMAKIKDLENVKLNAGFREKKEYIDKYLKRITIKQHDKFFQLDVEFNIIDSDKEIYIIPYPNYDFALELCNGIIIPLKEKDIELLDEILIDIYYHMGRVRVTYTTKELYDANIDKMYTVYLNKDNWDEELEVLGKKLGFKPCYAGARIPRRNRWEYLKD